MVPAEDGEVEGVDTLDLDVFWPSYTISQRLGIREEHTLFELFNRKEVKISPTDQVPIELKLTRTPQGADLHLSREGFRTACVQGKAVDLKGEDTIIVKIVGEMFEFKLQPEYEEGEPTKLQCTEFKQTPRTESNEDYQTGKRIATLMDELIGAMRNSVRIIDAQGFALEYMKGDGCLYSGDDTERTVSLSITSHGEQQRESVTATLWESGLTQAEGMLQSGPWLEREQSYQFGLVGASGYLVFFDIDTNGNHLKFKGWKCWSKDLAHSALGKLNMPDSIKKRFFDNLTLAAMSLPSDNPIVVITPLKEDRILKILVSCGYPNDDGVTQIKEPTVVFEVDESSWDDDGFVVLRGRYRDCNHYTPGSDAMNCKKCIDNPTRVAVKITFHANDGEKLSWEVVNLPEGITISKNAFLATFVADHYASTFSNFKGSSSVRFSALQQTPLKLYAWCRSNDKATTDVGFDVDLDSWQLISSESGAVIRLAGRRDTRHLDFNSEPTDAAQRVAVDITFAPGEKYISWKAV
eukprot:GHVS01020083.1.p1 GENE.GHVS01020083.1~~GHVS01020083.1.p1  ORF type:complete len:559 (-),score=38.51 GHVS01020083.1:123-1691(-)